MEILFRCHGPCPCSQWPDIIIIANALMKQLKNGENNEAEIGSRGKSHFFKLTSGHEDNAQKER